jgi:hypothetical protein
MDDTISDFDKLYDTVYKSIETDHITTSDLIVIVTKTMVLVQRYPNMTGLEKKQLVVKICQKIVATELVPEADREAMIQFIDVALPPTIDMIVAAYNHKFDLSKLRSRCCCLG